MTESGTYIYIGEGIMARIPETPYFRVARFANERAAGIAYIAVQQLIEPPVECDVSAYRFMFQNVFHVAVLGEDPPDEIGQGIDTALATGTPVDLPEEMRGFLIQRRAENSGPGHPWVEGHYRPGQVIRIERGV